MEDLQETGPGIGIVVIDDRDENEPSILDDERFIRKVRPAGFEPATDGLENRCSILLSYGRVITAELVVTALH